MHAAAGDQSMPNTPLGTSAAAPRAPRPGLPARAGIGLKPEHGQALLELRSSIGFLEIHAENYLGEGGPPHRVLRQLRERHPLSIHGVGMSIGGEQPLDQAHLRRIARLIERYQPESFSEHLAWSSRDGVFFNDLLPIAYTTPALQRVADHVDEVQDHLGRRLLLENPSTYVEFDASTWDEVEFMAEIVRRTGCGLLLDVNNVFVTCVNHRRDPIAYLDAVPARAIGEIHLAGHNEDKDAVGAQLLIDAHGSLVSGDVWHLYVHLLRRIGPVPTLIEWDNDVPALETLLAQAVEADHHLRSVRTDDAALRALIA